MNARKIYEMLYENPQYRMGHERLTASLRALSVLPKGTILDVACGRGEFIHAAEKEGFTGYGTEIVTSLLKPSKVIYADPWQEISPHAFGIDAFDYVTCFDALEHLTLQRALDTAAAMWKMARRGVIVSVNNQPSFFRPQVDGRSIDLHITRLPYAEWDGIFQKVFAGSVASAFIAAQSPVWTYYKLAPNA